MQKYNINLENLNSQLSFLQIDSESRTRSLPVYQHWELTLEPCREGTTRAQDMVSVMLHFAQELCCETLVHALSYIEILGRAAGCLSKAARCVGSMKNYSVCYPVTGLPVRATNLLSQSL